MATNLKNLSDYNIDAVPSTDDMRFGIVVAEWNYDITSSLAEGAIGTLLKHSVAIEDIIVKHVPGSFELTMGAQFMAENTDVDAIICLGCVIQGETPHFDYICQGVTQGINHVAMEYSIPVVFGVLTTNTLEQAKDRAGGKHGNKGTEAAITAIKMVALQRDLENYSEEESD
jgi:6,7-dimethyl-8-ribityllumazine synthase